MKNKAVLENHYGADVWTNKEMDELRKTECLCRYCGKLVPGDRENNCPIAQALFDICQSKEIAVAITRCPDFVEMSEV